MVLLSGLFVSYIQILSVVSGHYTKVTNKYQCMHSKVCFGGYSVLFEFAKARPEFRYKNAPDSMRNPEQSIQGGRIELNALHQ